MENYELQKAVLRILEIHVLEGRVPLSTRMRKYRKEEVHLYPESKEYVQEVFRVFPFLEDTHDAFDMAYLQLAYLFPAEQLVKEGYLELLYLENGWDNAFHLKPEKVEAILGPEAFAQLRSDEEAEPFTFQEIEGEHTFRLLPTEETVRYRETTKRLLGEHGWDIVYGLEDYLKPQPISTQFFVYHSSIQQAFLAYLQEKYPDQEWSKLNAHHLLREKMENLLLRVDTTQQAKIHWLKNLRLADGSIYVNVPGEIKRERKQIQEAIRGGFTFKR